MKLSLEIAVVPTRGRWGFASVSDLTTCNLVGALESAHQGSPFGCALLPIHLCSVIVIPESDRREFFVRFAIDQSWGCATDIAAEDACGWRRSLDGSCSD